MTKLGGWVGSVTRTRQLDFGSGPDSDPAYQWDSVPKLFSMAEVCALPSAIHCPKQNYSWESIFLNFLKKKKTFMFLFLNPSGVALAVCFGRWTSVPISAFLQRAAGFHLVFFCILLHPFSLLSWQMPQSLLRNIPKAWCCHHHVSQSGWSSLVDVLCWVWAKRNIFHSGQKVPSWFWWNSDHKTFCHISSESPECFFAYLKWDSRWAFWVMHSFLPHHCSGKTCGVLGILLSHAHSEQSLP